ncbi:MAG TPA: type I methionyl aminopeptidase [Thermohalobaculum sp.]|nr:type I methionyl aminopeptidase [Thermohalobaculum sp.]
MRFTGSERRTPEGIRLHEPADFEGMRRAGRLAAECLDMIGEHVAPGVRTEELDRRIHDFLTARGAAAATLGYRGYPKSSCISINHVVCHGIPGPRALRDGDILNIDVTAILDGWYGDTSRMFVAGGASRKAARLIEVTHEALMRGIAAVRPGNSFGDVGAAIQDYVEGERCSVVRDFCGHGLGRVFHDAPNVLHYGRSGEGAVFKPGMFFTIEPMVNLGGPQTKTLADNWTAVTRDRSLSAQFEHSVGVTGDGCEIFTLSPADRFLPEL